MGRTVINDQWDSSLRNLIESMNIDEGDTRQTNARRIALNLVEKFNAPTSFKFFYKTAYNLSECQIWDIFELANRPKITSPIKYFVKSCSKLMA